MGLCVPTAVIRVVACLLWLGLVLVTSRTGFAHESEHGSLPTKTIQDTEGDLELEGTLEILHEDREDGSGVYHHLLSTHDGNGCHSKGCSTPTS